MQLLLQAPHLLGCSALAAGAREGIGLRMSAQLLPQGLKQATGDAEMMRDLGNTAPAATRGYPPFERLLGRDAAAGHGAVAAPTS